MELPSAKPILSLKISVLWRERPFVRRSASWSRVLTWWTFRTPRWTISRTKWRSIWMCFIRECWTGLKLRWVAPKLSQSSLGCPDKGRPSSLNNERSHDVSEAALARALYSASVDERATALCFFELQEIGLTPRNEIYAEVEVRSSYCLPNPHQNM